MGLAIRAEGLRKRYGDTMALGWSGPVGAGGHGVRAARTERRR